MVFSQLLPVLRQYPVATTVVRIEPLHGAGGFSGANLWRLHCGSAPFGYCLRQWPAGQPAPDRLRWIHGVLDQVVRAGIQIVPAPLRTHSGASYVEYLDHLWEVSPWMPGVADYHQHPSPQRLCNAFVALGQFHVAAARSAAAEQARIPEVLAARSARIREWLARPRAAWLEKIDAFSRGSETVPSELASQLAAQALEVLTHFQRLAPVLARQLAAWNQAVPIQPCIRDIWHDHVLFEGDRVSGLVDFGAMQLETVAGDVARLLGSLAGDSQSDREIGLNAYESVRTLSHAERQLVPLLDRTSSLLSPMNWIQWLCVERRTFDHPQSIAQRVEGFLARLRRLSLIDLD